MALPTLQLKGWNRAAPRFIDAPEFEWETIPGATHYRLEWQAGYLSGRSELTEPAFDFAGIWNRLGSVDVKWTLAAVGPGGPLASADYKFYKAPDFSPTLEPALDWAAAARKNLNFLLDLPSDPKNGYPRYLTYSWHDTDPQGLALAYPALHFPSFIFLFLEALKTEKDPALCARIKSALAQVKKAVLECRVPDGIAQGMPLTILVTRDPENGRRSDRLTLFRIARMGQALLALHAWQTDPALLAFAVQIGDFLVKHQAEDGSLPFRLDPSSGEVVTSYTSATVSTVAFFESLSRVHPQPGYRRYVEKALRWTLENPCLTRRWEGMYEDVEDAPAFSNLENWDTLDAVIHLAGPGRELPGALETARRLNRFVEDQFVVFGPVPGMARSQVQGPLVMEQYICYYPMEVHTAHWIQGLLALHEATGEEPYRGKARAAANAIVAAQYEDGRFSTWGRNRVSGKSLNHEADWYGCNAFAGEVLYKMARMEKEAGC